MIGTSLILEERTEIKGFGCTLHKSLPSKENGTFLIKIDFVHNLLEEVCIQSGLVGNSIGGIIEPVGVLGPDNV